jgi:hypothetical protein
MTVQNPSPTPAPPAPVAPMPAPTPAAPGDRRGLAIASLVVGILSLCGSASFICGGLFSVVGIVLGALGLNSKGKNMAIAGIILAGIGLVLTIVFRIVFQGGLFTNMWNNLLQRFLNQ